MVLQHMPCACTPLQVRADTLRHTLLRTAMGDVLAHRVPLCAGHFVSQYASLLGGVGCTYRLQPSPTTRRTVLKIVALRILISDFTLSLLADNVKHQCLARRVRAQTRQSSRFKFAMRDGRL